MNIVRLFGGIGLILLVTLGGCAKRRGIEKLDREDGNHDLIEKAPFLGAPSGKGARTLWLYKVTIVKTSETSGFAFPSVQSYPSSAHLGHFEFSDSQLRFLKDITPYPVLSDTRLRDAINVWPIKSHDDYRLDENEGNTTNREVKNNRIPNKQRRYFTIDWGAFNITEANEMPYPMGMIEQLGWKKKNSYLVDDSLDISPDYISFVVGADYEQNPWSGAEPRRDLHNNYVFTIHYRYSFMKVDPSKSTYQAFGYNDPEKDPTVVRKMGRYFQRIRETSYNQPAYVPFKNDVFVERWDPNKTHNVYFSKDFPKEWKWIWYKVIDVTNKLFVDKGLPTRFAMRENNWPDGKAKELGDIRYLIVNVIPEEDGSGLLGHGPSDTNPLTGETISGSVTIWTGPLTYILKRLQQYAERNDPSSVSYKLDRSSLFKAMMRTLERKPAEWVTHNEPGRLVTPLDPSTGAGKAFFYDLLPDWTFGQNPRFTTGHVIDRNVDRTLSQFRTDAQVKEFAKLIHRQDGIVTEEMAQDSDSNARLSRLNRRYPDFNMGPNFMNLVGRFLERGLVEPAQISTEQRFEELARFIKIQEQKEDFEAKYPKTLGYPLDDAAVGASLRVLAGENPGAVLDDIMFQVSLHEFGHVLNLRHNFEGSVDKANWPRDEKGKPTGHSSSVMEYTRNEYEIGEVRDWHPYDKEALAYAYSTGRLDSDKPFMFCTDEHTGYNALCRRFDMGSTPTEAMYQLISQYENDYFVSNYRNDRAYWETGGYLARVFDNMRTAKRYLAFWQDALTSHRVNGELLRKGYSSEEANVYTDQITKELKEAIKLSIAYFDAINQQSSSERDWRNEYEKWTGEYKRLGIALDKQVATYFLMGDKQIIYNPNHKSPYTSIIAIQNEPELKKLVDKVFENNLTERVDMEVGFIGFGRALYAMSASTPITSNNTSLLDKIRVFRLSHAEVKQRYGIDVDDPAQFDTDAKEYGPGIPGATMLPKGDNNIRRDEHVGIVRYEGDNCVYITSESRSPYSFRTFKNKILQPKVVGGGSQYAKQDLLDFALLYAQGKGVPLPQCQ